MWRPSYCILHLLRCFIYGHLSAVYAQLFMSFHTKYFFPLFKYVAIFLPILNLLKNPLIQMVSNCSLNEDLEIFKRWTFLTFLKIFLPFLANFVHFKEKSYIKNAWISASGELKRDWTLLSIFYKKLFSIL